MIKRSSRLRALENQIGRLEKRLPKMERGSRRFSIARLLIFLGTAMLCALAVYAINEAAGWIVIALGLLVFNIVAHFHRRLDKARARHKIWLQLKTAQLGRMQLDWQAIPLPPITPVAGEHPFADDLDLTGRKSLQHLLDLAISHEGSQRLKDWLLATVPQPEQIQRRQALVRELAPMSRFRDKLLLNFALATREPLQGKKFLAWLQQETPQSSRRLLPVFWALAALNVALFLLAQFGLAPRYWLITLFIYGGLYLLNAERVKEIFEEAIFLDEELHKFGALLLYLEKYPYGKNLNLKNLCHPFWSAKKRPSAQMKKIKLVVTAIGMRMNPIVRALLNIVVPWDFHCAHLLDEQKSRLAEDLPVWLDIGFELEALTALANFAYLNPEYAFPEIVAAGSEPIFQAQGLGHPLIPAKQRVHNDFSFRRAGELSMITGSNMSGKSTFLKTLGINLSLAYAGGPVCAGRLQTLLFRLFACIKVSDSVTDGFSFFYAEVRRLKALLNELQEERAYPLFFLIDEIFKGTNNRERLIGSRSYIRALAGQNGAGAISTHDLELTTLTSMLPILHNYHFREEVIDGQMVFDYKLHNGPCPTTNALKIMQLAGLPVEL
jgi:ABC-type multidrug transport system fused ATPase/permease subunit